jgi:hypothetical protein
MKMRDILLALNAERDKDDVGNPMIKIGCGIGTGLVIAGQIGSEKRMEYTVIGDTVNQTNRIEGLNKYFGTDILIAENTWKLVKHRFITEEMRSVTVKGKEEPLRVFAVVNFKNKTSAPQTLAEVRAMLGLVPNEDDLPIYGGKVKAAISEPPHTEPTPPPPPPEKKEPIKKIVKIARVKKAYFVPPASMLEKPGRLVPVLFSWGIDTQFSDIDLSATNVIVEIAVDKDFNYIIKDIEVVDAFSANISLMPGNYWWRVYSASAADSLSGDYPSGAFTVNPNEKLRIKI